MSKISDLILDRVGNLSSEEVNKLQDEIAQAETALTELRAVMTVVRSSAMRQSSLPEPGPQKPFGRLTKQRAKKPKAVKVEQVHHRALPAPADNESNGKKPNTPPSTRFRLAMAEALLEHGPSTPSDLSVRAKVSRYGGFSVAALTRDHPWFEVKDGFISLTTAGHQAATGKE